MVFPHLVPSRSFRADPLTLACRAGVTAFLLLGLAWAGPAGATEPSAGEMPYLLCRQDLVQVTVFGEPDLALEQRIDAQGQVRVPLLGNVTVLGLAVRQAEELLEQRYVEEEFLAHPQVTLKVAAHSAKVVSVLGQVKSPGRVPFPLEKSRLKLVEVITMSGGFTGIAKGEAVRVTRAGPQGEQSFTVDVASLLSGRAAAANGEFLVEPDDVIFVPERLF